MNSSLVCIDIYTVNEGDTLYSIAEKYDLPVSLLMKVNGVVDPYNLQVGHRMCIPGTEDQLPHCNEEKFKSHIVEAGDTLYLIAKHYQIKLDDLMYANPNMDPYNLLIGTELRIPL
ncbi:MAG: LysM peptidoglycan-binding domain-containing protein [Firmicutes bacterium]|nr:LysM peptidoglycan-binding domain-containing protein [Bacillota bacterium]